MAGVGLAVASATGAPLAAYFALLLLQGCVTSVHAPASSSLIPLIMERGELERTNRIGSSLQELAAILGPGLAGLLLWLIRAQWVYAIVAVTVQASAAALSVTRR